MKKILLYFFTLLMPFTVYGQFQFGQTNQPVKTTKLDQAAIRCYYQWTQKTKDEKSQTDTMTLDIGAQMSEFYDNVRLQSDMAFINYFNSIDPGTIQSLSITKDVDAFDSGNTSSSVESGLKGETSRLFKNRLTGEITIIDYIDPGSPDKYKFTEKLSPQSWKITTDTATIMGYTCQKATTSFRGRNYVAWFSPAIPANDGPWKFFGLPGLILKVTDTEGIFSFICVGMENLNPPRDIEIQQLSYINCSRDELVKIKKKQSGGTRIDFVGGDMVISSKKSRDNHYLMELE